MTIRGSDGHIRSFRCDDDDWDAAKQQAESDGMQMSLVLRAFVRAYARGQLQVAGPVVISEVTR